VCSLHRPRTLSLSSQQMSAVAFSPTDLFLLTPAEREEKTRFDSLADEATDIYYDSMSPTLAEEALAHVSEEQIVAFASDKIDKAVGKTRPRPPRKTHYFYSNHAMHKHKRIAHLVTADAIAEKMSGHGWMSKAVHSTFGIARRSVKMEKAQEREMRRAIKDKPIVKAGETVPDVEEEDDDYCDWDDDWWSLLDLVDCDYYDFYYGDDGKAFCSSCGGHSDFCYCRTYGDLIERA